MTNFMADFLISLGGPPLVLEPDTEHLIYPKWPPPVSISQPLALAKQNCSASSRSGARYLGKAHPGVRA